MVFVKVIFSFVLFFSLWEWKELKQGNVFYKGYAVCDQQLDYTQEEKKARATRRKK